MRFAGEALLATFGYRASTHAGAWPAPGIRARCCRSASTREVHATAEQGRDERQQSQGAEARHADQRAGNAVAGEGEVRATRGLLVDGCGDHGVTGLDTER